MLWPFSHLVEKGRPREWIILASLKPTKSCQVEDFSDFVRFIKKTELEATGEDRFQAQQLSIKKSSVNENS